MKSTYEKPSERKKRITEENIKRVKKLLKKHLEKQNVELKERKKLKLKKKN